MPIPLKPFKKLSQTPSSKTSALETHQSKARRLENNLIFRARNFEARTPEGQLVAGPLNIELKVGECLLLKGENGSGKTTLIKNLLSTLPARHKPSSIPGSDFGASVEWGADEEEVSFLPQLGNLRFFLPMTLADVLGIQLKDEAAISRVESLGLLKRESLSLSWNTASGGERQKTLITRAFLGEAHCPPRLLIMDEPFNHLDVDSREALSQLLNQRLRAPLNAPPIAPLGVLLISHEQNLKGLTPEKTIDLGKALL